jgi:hypothetical protein
MSTSRRKRSFTGQRPPNRLAPESSRSEPSLPAGAGAQCGDRRPIARAPRLEAVAAQSREDARRCRLGADHGSGTPLRRQVTVGTLRVGEPVEREHAHRSALVEVSSIHQPVVDDHRHRQFVWASPHVDEAPRRLWIVEASARRPPGPRPARARSRACPPARRQGRAARSAASPDGRGPIPAGRAPLRPSPPSNAIS